VKKAIVLAGCLYLLQTAKQYLSEADSKLNELRMDSQRVELHKEVSNDLERYRRYLMEYEDCKIREENQKQ
jgi:hypothetical protein